MPKCDNCKYLHRTSYEYQEYECELFGEVPEGNMFTDNGCRYTEKTLKKKEAELRLRRERECDGWHIYGLEGDNARYALDNEIYKAILDEFIDKEVVAKMYEQLKAVILKEWETDWYKHKRIGHITGNWVSEEQFQENLRLKKSADLNAKE